ERKAIEAEGMRDVQQTVSQGISDSYLRWRGIEATLQLSQSTNAKVVIIGSGKDGLPIILGNADNQPPAASTPTGNDTSKQGTTAAGPSVPFEKTPAAGLTTPAEKVPPATSATPSAAPAASTAPAPEAAEPSRSLWLFILPTIKPYLTGGEADGRGRQWRA